jgi:patatin-related protein
MEATGMSNAAGNSGSVREVRIALVCYGGVSLAIYMHGVTRELHRLVIASSRFDEERNPFESSSTERVYWELLHELAAEDGVQTRVVVDVISGTSAGGINGVFLAKAVAHDLSQQSLRDLWFEEADVSKLLAGPRLLDPLGVKGKLAWFVLRALLAGGRVTPPLRGDRMCQLLYQALSAMAPPAISATSAAIAPERPDREGLLPPTSTLELFVTMTDARGHRRYLPIGNRRMGGEPLVVSDLTHRHVVRFALDPSRGEDHFAGGANDAALAFSARATSCFPGAFPPVSLADFMRDIGQPNSPNLPMIEREFFRAYQLARQGPRHTYFIDGGVLDNFPFGHAIEAITRKPAANEVKRWLVYIEPDPSRASSEPAGAAPAETAPPQQPGWVDTILAGLSSIPRKEPIVDDLVRVRAFNERVAYIADLTQTNYPQIETALLETDQDLRGGELSQADIGQVMSAMNQRARQRLGSGYASYLRLKLQGIADDVAEIVARAYAYPPDSGQASFVRTVMLAAIADRFPAGRAEVTEALVGFLRTFDLAFTDRRLRFVIQGVNDAYRQDNPRLGPLDPDRRQQLDMVKAELYAKLEQLWAVVSPPSVQTGVGQEPFGLFDEEQLAEPVRREVSPQQFAHDHRAQLDALLDRLGAYLDGALESFPGRLWEQFVAVTDGWPELQQLLLVRFLGFPVWDTLILPIVELSEIRQLRRIDVVRISPRDGQPGRLPPKELKGAAVHHFGAFFDRTAREHDFLWGRLDGVEQLLNLVAPDLDERWYYRAFQAVLDEEGPQLPAIQLVIEELRTTLPSQEPQTSGA